MKHPALPERTYGCMDKMTTSMHGKEVYPPTYFLPGILYGQRIDRTSKCISSRCKSTYKTIL